MFATACKLGREFLRPATISRRLEDGSVGTQLGAFIVLNKDGWIATVAHLFDPDDEFRKHQQERSDYQRDLAAARAMKSPREQRRRLAILKTNPKWITNLATLWGWDLRATLKDLTIIKEADLAIGRLEPFDPATVKNYPSIKDPAQMEQGTSLCRLGYAFYPLQTTFNPATGSFNVPTLKFPVFPSEGIYTRTLDSPPTSGATYLTQWLETSSPGLPGQSGGPVLDVHANVWGLQSRTRHIPLGFTAELSVDGKTVKEHQVMNIGIAVHARALIDALTKLGVAFSLAP